MGYFIRVLSLSDENIDLDLIENHLLQNKLKATIKIDEMYEDFWSRIIVSYKNGKEICVVERTLVNEGSEGRVEVNELLEEISFCKPKSAAEWLQEYLINVKVVYSFEILGGAYERNGWDIIGAIKEVIWGSLNAVIQADNEGFTNEDGYHILWQFEDDVDGDWYMAVLNSEGEWIKFKMDLGNTEQRNAFFQGEVPNGASLLD
jgi:hypothetical protein